MQDKTIKVLSVNFTTFMYTQIITLSQWSNWS